ncbi:MAG: hypothetical protein JNL21_02695 [Myxococcales bacterium]|nr:hypothetical protein [Myxococcales bacterium]
MTYREKAARPPARFDLRPATGFYAAAVVVTLLGVAVAALLAWGALQHGEPPTAVLVRGGGVFVLVAIFWLGSSAYRERGALVVDDEHVSLLDPEGRLRWQLPVAETSFELRGGVVVVLRGRGEVRRLSTRVFQTDAEVDRLAQALVIRGLGESADEMLRGVFSELSAAAQSLPADHDQASDAEMDARLDRQLERLD